MHSRRPAPFQLRRRESVREGLARIASSLAEPPRRDDSTRADLPKAIHRTRLALKRARALVRLLRPSLEPRVSDRLGQRLRAAGRRLAGARDATVSLEVLKRLARRHPAAESAALAQVQARFAQVVRDPKLQPAGANQSLSHAESSLRSTAVALTKASWRKRGWSILGAGIRKSHRRARRRLRAARDSTEASTFHAWRTASKTLLHQTQILRASASRRTEHWIADLNQLQADLGELNDLAVLSKQLATSPRRFGKKAAMAQTLAILKAEQERRRKAALSRGRRLFSERTPEFVDRLRREWKAWRGK